MPTAEARASRRWAWPALAGVLLGGLGLRLWGFRQGLPFAYNADEADHFVVHAVDMARHGTLNPHYFANPPAFTYLLRLVFALAYGGAHGVTHAFATHPGDLFAIGRVVAAVLGTGALWLTYLTGARLLGRGAGLLAAAIEAVAFLPVFYSHLALNDVPTLAPLTLSLLGSAGVLRRGRLADHALAGVGLGLACASKYTAGIALAPYAAAAAASFLQGGEGAARRVLSGLVVCGVLALGAFLLANPYALLDYSAFHGELVHQSTLSAEAQGKLGAPKDGGLAYYLWSLTWGLGWVPALAALGGAVAIWWRERALGWMLVPAPLLFGVFMGTQGRYFGRWLMPIVPILCLLAAFFALASAKAAARRTRTLPRPASVLPGALIVLALLAQGLVYSIHSGLVLSRADTRNATRAWMLANVPFGAKVVVEPVAPDAWVREVPGAPGCNGHRWCKYASEYSRIAPDGSLLSDPARFVGVENYERTLAPSLLGYYEREGFCWVVTGSTQSGRAYADPAAVPLAIAYYRALRSQATLVYSASPYGAGQRPVAFNFDWSFDYYPLAYSRPGPQMSVYRLGGGRCGRGR